MPTTLSWTDIALRLALAALAGSLIGLNRAEKGRVAGLRTTMLVCLAAAVSMVQANVLMSTTGKAHDSFVVLDLMRLPLGILTGVGFIGAGAILHKENLVIGVTTAATLWYVTVLGLCFGGGQLGLGLSALALALVLLGGLRLLEDRLHERQYAELVVRAVASTLSEDDLSAMLEREGYRPGPWSLECGASEPGAQRLRTTVHWRSRPGECHLPAFLKALRSRSDVLEVMWKR